MLFVTLTDFITVCGKVQGVNAKIIPILAGGCACVLSLFTRTWSHIEIDVIPAQSGNDPILKTY